MLADEVDEVVTGLRTLGLVATARRTSVNRVCVRVALPSGAEALWDTDGALGLEAQIMANGMLVGFVPHIPGSEGFDIEQTCRAIATADYGRHAHAH